MIISASRRTDIPAFYSSWFMDKINRAYCIVSNPFNPQQVKLISLKTEDVDLFVFWTKNPAPFIPHLGKLDRMGYYYYFLFTLNPYSEEIELGLKRVEKRIDVFQELSRLIGPEKVIWRYDPIIITRTMDFSYHREKFDYLSSALQGMTRRVIISFYSPYRSADKRLKKAGLEINLPENREQERMKFLNDLAEIAGQKGMLIQGCAQKDLEGTGIERGKCIDNDYIAKIFRLRVPAKKDTGQRRGCGCIPSQDIGYYNTCLHGCLYCYGWGSIKRVEKNCSEHVIDSPFLVGKVNERIK